MLARSLTAILAASTAVVAWPISFYSTNDCASEPVLVLHEPPAANKCGFFDDTVKSYSGGTDDKVQKVLLYYDHELCFNDAAHRNFNNHTINNNRNDCIPFKRDNEVPRSFTYIEEILPVRPLGNLSSACNVLVSQN